VSRREEHAVIVRDVAGIEDRVSAQVASLLGKLQAGCQGLLRLGVDLLRRVEQAVAEVLVAGPTRRADHAGHAADQGDLVACDLTQDGELLPGCFSSRTRERRHMRLPRAAIRAIACWLKGDCVR
jgi:hypothetical protein